MSVLLTFDVGTTSMKCCAFDENFSILASSTVEYTLNTRGEHIVEADPNIYWDGMCKSIRNLQEKGIDLKQIVSCGITTQGETSIVLNKDLEPICPAIVWLDDRADTQAAWLASEITLPKFYQTTGLPEIGGAVPLAKLKMLMENPDIKARAYKILLLEDYLVFKLTGQIKTEHSLICSTGYYDIINHSYRDDFLSLAGATRDLLPEVLPCGTVAGKVTKDAASQTLLPEGIPVVLTAMDQTASAIGAGNVRSGIVSETTGTCLTVVATTEKPDFTTGVPLQYYTHYDNQYLVLAYNTTAAIIMKWFKDEFIAQTEECKNSPLNAYDYMSQLAAAVEPGCEGLTMLPHFAGKAMPNFCPNVRGCFYGVSLNTKKAHFIRAIMEGVSYMLRENLESFEKAGIPLAQIRSLGGGARDTVWSSIKASITGKTLVTTQVQESTSLGAAFLSAKAIGMTADVPSLADRIISLGQTFAPDTAQQTVYNDLYQKYLQLDRAIAALSAK